MERKRRIPGPDGELINVTELGFRDHSERWNEYLLDDGTIERARRRLGEHGEGTILFLDEVHRFNKAQQDTLLPRLARSGGDGRPGWRWPWPWPPGGAVRPMWNWPTPKGRPTPKQCATGALATGL